MNVYILNEESVNGHLIAPHNKIIVSEPSIVTSQDTSTSCDSKSIEDVSIYDLIPSHAITKTERQMKTFVRKIKTDGHIINESIKYVIDNGRKYIVDGHHRYYAAQKLGITRVSAQQVQLPYVGYKNAIDLRFDGKMPVWWRFFNPQTGNYDC